MRVSALSRTIIKVIALAVAAACTRQGQFRIDEGVAIERRQQVLVLPNGYRGPVMVIYDQPGGAKPETIDGQVSYDVPSDGIVRTAFPEEVLAGATVKFVYKSGHALVQYHRCTQMRMEGLAGDPTAVCWLAVQVGGAGMPDHAVYIVTDWAGIPENYDRGAWMLDSAFFGGKGLSRFKWREPVAPPSQRTA